jgi:hypothetical protein
MLGWIVERYGGPRAVDGKPNGVCHVALKIPEPVAKSD